VNFGYSVSAGASLDVKENFFIAAAEKWAHGAVLGTQLVWRYVGL